MGCLTATVGWLHGRGASSYSPPGANYGGPLAAPKLELPRGVEGRAPYPSGCFAPGHVTHALLHLPLPLLGQPVRIEGKLIRAPWWWPDPWGVVPRVEDRISPYSGVPPQLPPERGPGPPEGGPEALSRQDQAGRWRGGGLSDLWPKQGKAGGVDASCDAGDVRRWMAGTSHFAAGIDRHSSLGASAAAEVPTNPGGARCGVRRLKPSRRRASGTTT